MSVISRNVRTSGDASRVLMWTSIVTSASLAGLVLIQSFLSDGQISAISLTCGCLALLLAGAGCHSTLWLAHRESVANDLAGHDALSGLPNRRLFAKLLDAEISRTRRDSGSMLAVLLLDLDYFKTVNDTHGHAAGDEIIVQTARRLREQLRLQDVLARLSGDEFAIVMTGMTTREDCLQLARRLKNAMTTPFAIEETQVTIGVSIGIAMCPDHSWSCEGLLRCADAALYDAKRDGRNTFALFEPQTGTAIALRQTEEGDLLKALYTDRLDVAYQPVVSPDGYTLVGAEALVRWNHPEKGPLFPTQILHSSKNQKLTRLLGDWLFRRACADALGWPNIRVAVGVSPAQFQRDDFVDTVFRAMNDASLEGTRIELQLSHACLAGEIGGVLLKMNALRARGIAITLIYEPSCSLNLFELRRIPFSKMKVDRTTIHEAVTSGTKMISTTSVLQMGRALNLTLSLTGIETEPQQSLLRDLGAQEFQGPRFSAPLSAREVTAICAGGFLMPGENATSPEATSRPFMAASIQTCTETIPFARYFEKNGHQPATPKGA